MTFGNLVECHYFLLDKTNRSEPGKRHRQFHSIILKIRTPNLRHLHVSSKIHHYGNSRRDEWQALLAALAVGTLITSKTIQQAGGRSAVFEKPSDSDEKRVDHFHQQDTILRGVRFTCIWRLRRPYDTDHDSLRLLSVTKTIESQTAESHRRNADESTGIQNPGSHQFGYRLDHGNMTSLYSRASSRRRRR
jgi:hypothetical protein